MEQNTAKTLEAKLDYDEETLKEKIKNKSGTSAIIGLGLLNLVHSLSHILPAIGALGMSQLERHHEAMIVFNYDLAPILTNPIMQVAYVAFVPLSFYYLYRDHKHHKHERAIRQELYEVKQQLEDQVRLNHQLSDHSCC